MVIQPLTFKPSTDFLPSHMSLIGNIVSAFSGNMKAISIFAGHRYDLTFDLLTQVPCKEFSLPSQMSQAGSEGS